MNIQINKVAGSIMYLVFVFYFFSCKKFVDVELTGSRITEQVTFADDNTASSAIVGLYFDLSTSNIGSGSSNSLSRLSSLSSDELYDFYRNANSVEFEINAIKPENTDVYGLWNALYKSIFNANAILEGLSQSNTLSSTVKEQLYGEALFVRAFCHFNLVNFFGDVPLVNSTDYKINSSLARTDKSAIYSFIINDLSEAKIKLSSDYVGGSKTRVNAQAASAMLAKVHLYIEDWEKAAQYATEAIDDPKYAIVTGMRDVFLIGSQEAIWQIAPPDPRNITDEAFFYVTTSSPRGLVLRKEFAESFATTDLRFATWVGSVVANGENVYFPYKYTLQDASLPIKEYSAILRLAEQYLIRAEARAHLEDIDGAVADLDKIRGRAGLSSIAEDMPDIDQETLLTSIETERKFELFTEWASRWFDLKRTGRAEAVLSSLKPGFTINDELYPLPAQERSRNPKLGSQNPGY